MIKINLMPPEFRRRRKVPFVDRILIYVLLSIIFQVMFLYFYNMQQKSAIKALNQQIQQTQSEIKNMSRY